MSIVQIVLAAIVLLGPLIAIHEFGHFWVARRFGIKVLVFSIGFGPVLLKRMGKDGVQYQLAAIPLGGYVKMADEREGEVAEADMPYAFNRQSPWVRMAVVVAGPLINLIFAVLLFWVLFLPASEQLNTRIGSVDAGSPAAQSGLQVGDRIIAIDHQPTTDWETLNYALVERMGETGTLAVTAEHGQITHNYTIPLRQFMSASSKDPLSELGFFPWQPVVDAVIGDLDPTGAAAKQGLQVGDRILQINQHPVTGWLEMTRLVRQSPEKNLNMTVLRGQKTLELDVMPQGKKDAMGQSIGFLGMGAKPPATHALTAPADYRQTIQYDPLTAASKAVVKTWDMSMMTVAAFGKMLRGLIGLDNLSGPITIAKIAGHTADLGWQAFISFMAMMSVSLGILNLMPIPVLDGGHLVYYFIEGVRGRPISERIQEFGLRIGMALLGMMMLIALFNDVSRLG
jgi:regulator of sigma E protease